MMGELLKGEETLRSRVELVVSVVFRPVEGFHFTMDPFTETSAVPSGAAMGLRGDSGYQIPRAPAEGPS